MPEAIIKKEETDVQRQVRKQSGCEGRDEIPKAQLQPSHGNGEVWWENEGKYKPEAHN